jgi:hypothetical protein
MSFVERAARPEPEDIAGDLLGLAVLPVVRALTTLARTHQGAAEQFATLRTSVERLEQRLAELAAAHAELGAMAGAALRDAGRLEGEKVALQQQLELLTWQNQLLHTQLQGPARRAMNVAGQFGRRLWRRRS